MPSVKKEHAVSKRCFLRVVEAIARNTGADAAVCIPSNIRFPVTKSDTRFGVAKAKRLVLGQAGERRSVLTRVVTVVFATLDHRL